MSLIEQFAPTDLVEDRTAVFANQGIPAGEVVSARIEELYEGARELLARVAVPVSMVAEIGADEFTTIYAGEGQNEPETPVGEIYRRATDLALFAVTLGAEVSREIERRFAANDLAVASMLDAVASVAADMLAAAVQDRHGERLAERMTAAGAARSDAATPAADAAGGATGAAVDGASPPVPAAADLGVLRYSPGYCGWHVTGQRRLFAALRPEQIGITLGDSCLMEPLKSVSGVLIAGPRKIHQFKDAFPFCEQCTTRGCRERLRALYA